MSNVILTLVHGNTTIWHCLCGEKILFY